MLVKKKGTWPVIVVLQQSPEVQSFESSLTKITGKVNQLNKD